MAKKASSSKQWLKDHFNDIYVQQAQKDGFRSRAVYKLEEIQGKDRVIKPGMTIVDLGAAPGGWSQYVSKCLNHQGRVIALDILPMDPLAGVTIIEGDFREEAVLNELLSAMKGEQADIVMSDMAPNFSGMKAVDQPRSMHLVELALDCAHTILKPGGTFITKVFQGEGFTEFLQQLRREFKTVRSRKPKASNGKSPEFYLVAMGFKGL